MSIQDLNLVKIKFNATTTDEMKAQKQDFAKFYNSNKLKFIY
jgi:hypothetical protein